MAFDAHKNAVYKITATEIGNKYNFYCELSGGLICTTHPYAESNSVFELEKAWQEEGKVNFNLCRKCGKWVCNAMYNADVFMCVECAPWVDCPKFCPNCGTKFENNCSSCRKCGKKLQYGGETDEVI